MAEGLEVRLRPWCWEGSSGLHKGPVCQELTFWWEEGEKTEEQYTKFMWETLSFTEEDEEG